MSFEWPILPLGDLTINFDGKRRPVKESERKPGPFPYYGASGVVDHVDGYLFDGSYLLIGEDGENMRTRQTPIAFMASGKFWVNNHAHIVTGNDLADTRFLMYSLLNADIHSYLTGAVMPKLTQGNLNKILLACPPREVQKDIVGVLGALDDRITLLRETNATLEAIAQALFKSWFVDFDPVRARMEGRAPEGMDEATAALFPDGFEESELGLVPRGWRVESIYAIANLIYGAPFASKQFNSNGIGTPLIRIRDLRDEAPGVFTPEVHPKGYMVQPGDLVVGMDGEFRAYLWGGDEAWLNQRVCVFVPKPGFPAAYVHRSINPLLAAVEASETATTVIHLGKNDIDRFRILVPDHHVLAAFGRLTDGLYGKSVQGKQSARTLATLRDTLLPRLISGQLRLPELAAAETHSP